VDPMVPPQPLPSLGRILVVDDEPHVGALVRDVFSTLGYAVKHVVSGAEALELVPVFEPDLVLLDLLMPGVSGVGVLEHLVRDHPQLPVIVISGTIDIEIARRTLETSAVDYLEKPFDIAVLARVLAAALAPRPPIEQGPRPPVVGS
jgi:CheY-like chemotaxis protein